MAMKQWKWELESSRKKHLLTSLLVCLIVFRIVNKETETKLPLHVSNPVNIDDLSEKQFWRINVFRNFQKAPSIKLTGGGASGTVRSQAHTIREVQVLFG